MISIIVLGEF